MVKMKEEYLQSENGFNEKNEESYGDEYDEI
jgi:hypothetical protein